MGNKLSLNITNKLFRFFLDCISFNTPKAIVFNMSTIFLALIIIPTNYLVSLPSSCIFRNIILPIIFKRSCPTNGFFANCQCPACGLTRAMSSLLHGDIHAALEYNVLVIPLFFIMIYVLILNIIKIKNQTN